jgi:glutathione S-transferase
MTAKLITIAFSHYCEKARWALDRCGVPYSEEAHLPLFHYLATYRNGAKRTVPVLIADESGARTVVRDSTDIVAWADKHRPGSLIPVSGAEDALAIEDDLDNHFGPATRRWAYYYLLPNRDADPYIVDGAPRWQRALLKVGRPVAVGFLRRGLKIDDAGLARSLAKIEATMSRVDEIVADGRSYLAGDRFTVADLTFAALASPILLPPEHPVHKIPIDLLPRQARDQVQAWRERPAGRFGLSLYTRERSPARASSAA